MARLKYHYGRKEGISMIVILRSVLGRPGGDLLSRALRQSTIGAEAFNCRVRDGIGFRHLARTTRPAKDRSNHMGTFFSAGVRHSCFSQALIMRVIKPIELLVPVSFTHCCASTPGLSTW